MTLDVEKLKAKVTESGYTIREFADFIGMDHSTFYRKLNAKGETFTVREVKKIGEALSLNQKEMFDIFFNENVA